jgi:cysteine desulfurase
MAAGQTPVYLDHQASTPVLPEVFEAMRPWFSDWFGSAASQHQLGLRARDALIESRRRVAGLIRAENPEEEILFTSGATEAANLAVKGSALAARSRGDHIVISAIEHPSVLNSALFLEKNGFRCTRVACNREGFVRPEDVAAAITDKTVLVAVHLANHDIGAIQPIESISRITRERGIPLFCDASACGGWLPIDVRKLGAQLLTLAPHRFYGPKGVGILYRHRQARIESLIHGGKQEDGLRAGTENIPAIVGAATACEIATRDLQARQTLTAELQRKLIDGLLKRIDSSRLNGPPAGPGRLSTNVNISIDGIDGESLLLLCDLQGIALASGPSCVARNIKIPHVLEAIGLTEAQSRGNVLLTLGTDNTAGQIDYVLDTLPRLVEKLRSMSPSWKS